MYIYSNYTTATGTYTLSLHDALPIWSQVAGLRPKRSGNLRSSRSKVSVLPRRLPESPLLRLTFRNAARRPKVFGQGRREIKRFVSDGRPAQQSFLRRSARLQLDARQMQIARQRAPVNLDAGAAVVTEEV